LWNLRSKFNQETSFSTNLILNDEIIKKILIKKLQNKKNNKKNEAKFRQEKTQGGWNLKKKSFLLFDKLSRFERLKNHRGEIEKHL